MATLHCIRSAAAVLLTLPIAAQGVATQAAQGTIHTLPRTHGIHRTPEGFHAVGPDYKAELTRRGILFTPALGRGVADNMPLGLELMSVGRVYGGDLAIPETQPVRDGDTVRWVRPEFTERVAVAPGGIEQSYVFPKALPGRGKLVVRQRIATGLVPGPTTADGVEFTALDETGQPIGGVRVGGVWGIDAAGRRVRGSLAVRGEHLEYSLPERFVEEAEYPLVLDPFITPFFLSATTLFDDYQVDVVQDCDSTTGALVWTRQFSGSDSEIRAQVVDLFSGAAIGGLIAVTSNAVEDFDPAVATLREDDSFVIVWTQVVTLSPLDTDIRGRIIGFSGVAGNEIAVAGGAGIQAEPDISSNPDFSANDRMLVVYSDSVGADIRGARLETLANGDLVRVLSAVPVAVSTLYADSQPAISNWGGEDTSSYCIVWRRNSTFTGAQIRGAVVNSGFGFLDSLVPITSTSLDVARPAVDGNGEDWVVAWEQEEFAGSATTNVVCQAIRWDPALGGVKLVGNSSTAGGFLGTDEMNPAVAHNGLRALVLWEREVNPSTRHIVASVRSPFDGSQIENPGTILGGSDDFSGPATSLYLDNLTDQLPMIVGFSRDGGASASQDAGWVVYDSPSGDVNVISPSCGGGRIAVVNNFAPNAGFSVGLVDGDAGAPCFAILSLDLFNAQCSPGVPGTCRLVPDPFTGAVFPLTLDANGDGSVPIAIPSTATGLKFYAQFLTPIGAGPVGCPGLLNGADLSEGALITIR